MIYARIGAYLAAVLACIGLGWYLGSLGPKAKLAQLQAQDWQSKYQASQLALNTVQAELAQEKNITSHNGTVIEGLENENAKIAADRDADLQLARRLLDSAKVVSSSSAPMPKASGGQTASSSGQTSGPSRLEGLLADAAAESERCAAQLNSLISEIQPQL